MKVHDTNGGTGHLADKDKCNDIIYLGHNEGSGRGQMVSPKIDGQPIRIFAESRRDASDEQIFFAHPQYQEHKQDTGK